MQKWAPLMGTGTGCGMQKRGKLVEAETERGMLKYWAEFTEAFGKETVTSTWTGSCRCTRGELNGAEGDDTDWNRGREAEESGTEPRKRE
jgi:hypothetical protein